MYKMSFTIEIKTIDPSDLSKGGIFDAGLGEILHFPHLQ